MNAPVANASNAEPAKPQSRNRNVWKVIAGGVALAGAAYAGHHYGVIKTYKDTIRDMLPKTDAEYIAGIELGAAAGIRCTTEAYTTPLLKSKEWADMNKIPTEAELKALGDAWQKQVNDCVAAFVKKQKAANDKITKDIFMRL